MKSKNFVLKLSLIVVAILLLFSAVIFASIAYFSGVRHGTGTMKFDSGLAVDYYGFADGSIDNDVVWDKSADIKLFKVSATSDSVVPNQQINIPSANIGVNEDSINFFARAKIEYRFYDDINGGEEHLILDRAVENSNVITDYAGVFSQSAASLFTTNWVLSNDGWYYYSLDGTPTLILKDDNNTSTTGDGPVAVFNGNSYITMSIHPNYLSQNAGERVEKGGYPYTSYDGTESEIKRIEATLVLDVIQGDANLISAGWQVVTD